MLSLQPPGDLPYDAGTLPVHQLMTYEDALSGINYEMLNNWREAGCHPEAKAQGGGASDTNRSRSWWMSGSTSVMTATRVLNLQKPLARLMAQSSVETLSSSGDRGSPCRA